MSKLRAVRLMLLAFALSLVPASSFAGVFISVGIAPPALPVYEVPPCPEPGWMWTPGFWSYGADGYYWVPGAWVPAPYEGALWTPGYWGWGDGAYMWHPGYWGRHIGYYGGVNYGGGYLGIGFVGGEWHGRDFAYNTAVMHVGPSIHNTYVNNTIIVNHTVINNNHVAFSGGPGGVNHMPGADERMAMHEQHMAPTSFQSNHQAAAMGDRNNFARFNGGRPSNAAMARPMGMNGGGGNRGGFGGGQSQQPGGDRGGFGGGQMQQRGGQSQFQQQGGGNRGGFGGGQAQQPGGDRGGAQMQPGGGQGQQRGGFMNQMRSFGGGQQQGGARGGAQPQQQSGGNHGGGQPQGGGGNHGGGDHGGHSDHR